jgi:hypothetical protein
MLKSKELVLTISKELNKTESVYSVLFTCFEREKLSCVKV